MNSYEMIADHYLVVGGPSLIAFQGTPEDVDHKRFLMGRRDVTTDDYGNLHVIASHQPRIFGKWHYWMSGIDEMESGPFTWYPEFH